MTAVNVLDERTASAPAARSHGSDPPAPEIAYHLPRAALLAVVIVSSIVVRVVHLANVYPTPIFSFHRTWTVSDMYIFNAWAERIVNGDFLGRQPYNPLRDLLIKAMPAANWNQWFGNTPVFFKAPLYPYLIALLRWAFGDAMLPVAVLQIVASALSALLLFLITERTFDRSSAFVAALSFALYAPAIHYDVVMLRGPWIALVSVLITWQLIRFRQRPTNAAAVLLGLVVGWALLLNEGSLFLPPLVVVVAGRWLRGWRERLSFAARFTLGLGAGILPVIVRNLLVGVPAFHLAATGGAIMALTNAGDADPVFFQHVPPASFQALLEASGGKLLSLIRPCMTSFGGPWGFLAFYLRRATGLVVPLENADNANFYYAVLRSRVLTVLPTYAVLFPLGVLGLALAAQRWRKLEPLVPASVAQLLSIMVSLPMSRYRLVLAVFLFPFVGLALVQVGRWIRARRFATLAVAAIAVALVSVAVRLLERDVIFKDREPTSVTYRAAEFNLAAEAYVKQGKYGEAARELIQLAQLCRVPAVQAGANIRAARFLVRTGDPVAARVLQQSAWELGANDPAALFAMGEIYGQYLGDADNARRAYQALTALAPQGFYADTARARLRDLGAVPPNK